MCQTQGHEKLVFSKDVFNDLGILIISKEKYLGAFIPDYCNDEDMIRQRSIYASGNAHIRNFKHCSEEVMALLFKTYCTGFHWSSLWCKYKCKTYNKVKVTYNNSFWKHMIHGQISVSQTMIYTHIEPFNAVTKKYIAGFSKWLDSVECDC